jgi:ADP-heptose:LPS heptosyltransferase
MKDRFLGLMKMLIKAHVAPAIFRMVFGLDRMALWLAGLFVTPRSDLSIVFVRTDNLGDFVLWQAIARTLRDRWPWPRHRFVLVANAKWAQFAIDLKLFDEVVAVERVQFQRNIFYRMASVFRLNRLAADLVVTPILSRDPIIDDSIARAIRAKRKWAVESNSHKTIVDRSVSGAWYTDLVSMPPERMHEALGNKEFLARAFGLNVEVLWPELGISPRASLPTALDKLDYVVIAPGATSALKIWPPKRFAALANKLNEKKSMQVVLIGTATERNIAKTVAQSCSKPPIDLTGQLNFQDLLIVLKRSKLILTNDTGAAHLGAALRVPTICLVGGGHFGDFFPYPEDAARAGLKCVVINHQMSCYNCSWRCIHPIGIDDPAPCVAGISVHKVWMAAKEALSSNT